MHRHSRNQFRQHFLLKDLQSTGNVAIYCTSAVKTKSELDQCYATDRIFDASAVFFPSTIKIPSVTEEHHVSFDQHRQRWCVYSEAGEPVEHDIPTISTVIEHLRLQPQPSIEAELARFRAIADDFANIGPDHVRVTRDMLSA
jgi:hypothetical protein